jgi:hypothetical protein
MVLKILPSDTLSNYSSFPELIEYDKISFTLDPKYYVHHMDEMSFAFEHHIPYDFPGLGKLIILSFEESEPLTIRVTTRRNEPRMTQLRETKFCRDCRFVLPASGSEARCSEPTVAADDPLYLTHGTRENLPKTVAARMKYGLCGKEGKLFQQSPEHPRRTWWQKLLGA